MKNALYILHCMYNAVCTICSNTIVHIALYAKRHSQTLKSEKMVFGAKDRKSFCKDGTDIGSKTTLIESLFIKLQEVLINTDLLVKKGDQ